MIDKEIIKELRKYTSKSAYSYTQGFFTTINLLEKCPEQAYSIVLSTKAKFSKGIDKLYSLAEKFNIPINVNDKSFDILKLSSATYCIGIFQKFDSSLKEGNHIVLVEPENFGNLGTIVRTACGFDIINLAIIKPAADIFNPECIRSSMGSTFDINFEYFDSLENYKLKHNHNNLYLFYTDGQNELKKTQFKEPYSLVFGREGSGLDEKYKSYGTTVKIEQSKLIDSLNLAISVGIAMYQAKK